MNYEGCVSSIDTVRWTFTLDKKVTVHIGHLAAFNNAQFLPEIGENVKISRAHFKTNSNNSLEALFLCEQSELLCNYYKHYVRDTELLSLILDYNLGVSDLLEIEYNICVINEFIVELSLQTGDAIIFQIVRSLATSSDLHKHCCLNKALPPFILKTVSKCCYIDTQNDVSTKAVGPSWFFGTHSKADKREVLIGYLQVNKRYGMIMLYDCKHQMPCLLTTRNVCEKKNILDKFVLIKEYRVFTETYREAGVPNFEYLLFDVVDVAVLDVSYKRPNMGVVLDALPSDYPYVYDFQCCLIRKSSVTLRDSSIECWLEIDSYNSSKQYSSYLGLNAYQMRLIPFLNEHEVYHIYHTEKLKECKNIELQRINPHAACYIFNEKDALFISVKNKETESVPGILGVPEVLDKIKENSTELVSFQGLLKQKKLTPSLSSRTQRNDTIIGFGTPGSSTHSLIFEDDSREFNVLLYLNNWERLQIPLGLIIDMRICVRNVLVQKNKYLKSTAMTTLQVLAYEPKIMFDTVNLSTNIDRPCDKYSYAGLGDLLPCGVLIWTRPIQVYVRSLKIWYNECLNTSITLFVVDERGQALVISKSVDLLRLLLGLEPNQWKIWCEAFEMIGEYIYDHEDTKLYTGNASTEIFIHAVSLLIKIINTTRINTIELKCRKMEGSKDDNEGMPLWFCTEAKICDIVK